MTTQAAGNDVVLTYAGLREIACEALYKNGLSEANAAAAADVLTAGERDESRSHGVFRVIGCVDAVRSGKVDGHASPTLVSGNSCFVQVDANRGFAPLANTFARDRLVTAARQHGLAALSITNCFHFSALWPDLEPLAAAGLVAFAFTSGQCHVVPPGGVEPVLGTNPLAFAWPRRNARPLILDLATSAIARGDIELHRRASRPIPAGWAVDPTGQPTTDAAQALAGGMLPFGGHKGMALGMMIELLAGPLVGGMTSREAQAADERPGPNLGSELILALDPDVFSEGAIRDKHAETLFASFLRQPGVRLPSDRRYAARDRAERDGIRISVDLFEELRSLAA